MVNSLPLNDKSHFFQSNHDSMDWACFPSTPELYRILARNGTSLQLLLKGMLCMIQWQHSFVFSHWTFDILICWAFQSACHCTARPLFPFQHWQSILVMSQGCSEPVIVELVQKRSFADVKNLWRSTTSSHCIYKKEMLRLFRSQFLFHFRYQKYLNWIFWCFFVQIRQGKADERSIVAQQKYQISPYKNCFRGLG